MGKETVKNKYFLVGGLFIAVIFPFLGLSPYLLNIAIIMLVFILFASAWNFLAYSGQASLGHAAFFGIGAYGSTIIAKSFSLTPFLSVIAGGGVAAIIGLFIGLTCVRLKEWFLAMVTFGFAVIIQTLTASPLAFLTGGWNGISSPRLLNSDIPGYMTLEYYIILAFAVVCIYGIYLILRSRIGLAFMAIKENEVEARAAGVDVVRYKILAFIISTFIAGVAGALETHYFGYITPEIFGAEISFWPIIYSIFGGLGTISGPIIGTIFLTGVWESLKAFGLTFELFIIIGLLLILVVIFLPKGLISLPKEWSAWRKRRERRPWTKQ
jgi:branched-chain amino acid transport system permease protein